MTLLQSPLCLHSSMYIYSKGKKKKKENRKTYTTGHFGTIDSYDGSSRAGMSFTFKRGRSPFAEEHIHSSFWPQQKCYTRIMSECFQKTRYSECGEGCCSTGRCQSWWREVSPSQTRPGSRPGPWTRWVLERWPPCRVCIRGKLQNLRSGVTLTTLEAPSWESRLEQHNNKKGASSDFSQENTGEVSIGVGVAGRDKW